MSPAYQNMGCAKSESYAVLRGFQKRHFFLNAQPWESAIMQFWAIWSVPDPKQVRQKLSRKCPRGVWNDPVSR